MFEDEALGITLVKGVFDSAEKADEELKRCEEDLKEMRFSFWIENWEVK